VALLGKVDGIEAVGLPAVARLHRGQA
jgi:hypothetical protein